MREGKNGNQRPISAILPAGFKGKKSSRGRFFSRPYVLEKKA